MVMWWFHQKPNRVFNLTVVREKKVMSTPQFQFFMVCTSISKFHIYLYLCIYTEPGLMLPFSCPPSLTAYGWRRLNTAINHTIESMHIRSCSYRSYPPPAILRDIFRVLFQTVCSTCYVCQSGNLSTEFSVWTFPQLPWTKLLSKYNNELTRAQPFLSQLRLTVIIKTIVKYSNWEHLDTLN